MNRDWSKVLNRDWSKVLNKDWSRDWNRANPNGNRLGWNGMSGYATNCLKTLRHRPNSITVMDIKAFSRQL